MKQFFLLRHYTPMGTFGILTYEDKEFCKIVERAPPAYDKEHPCIPEGSYVCVPYLSPTKGNVFLVKDVPGRTFIEFHIANSPRDLLGCLAPVNRFACVNGEWGGIESGTSPRGAFLRLKALIGDDQEFRLDISSFKG